MQQEVEIVHGNKDGIYSHITVESIYNNNHRLVFFVNVYEKKPDQLQTPEELMTKVAFDNGEASKDVKISDVIFIYPDSLERKKSLDPKKAAELIQHATLLYGKDRSKPTPNKPNTPLAMVHIQNLPWLNLTWLRRNLFTFPGMLWGAGSMVAAGLSIFAAVRLGKKVDEVVPKNEFKP